MNTIWKPIKNFEEIYLISNHGEVKSLKRKIPVLNHGEPNAKSIPEKILKPEELWTGRLRVTLIYKGKKVRPTIHRLVAQHFIPNNEDKPCINHINGNPKNNYVDNLEWCTYKENMDHASRLKLNARGSKNGASKLTEKKVLQIRALYKTGEYTQEKLSIQYKVSPGCIWNILSRRYWKHI